MIFLDQTYCDPTRQTNCAVATAWDPDLPETVIADPSDPVARDEIFDYVYEGRCAGSRSLCMFIAMPERLGECGSGLWREKHDLATEFARLAMSEFRGRSVYHLPKSSEVMSVSMADGTHMPIYGRTTATSPRNSGISSRWIRTRYQARWLVRWVRRNGPHLDLTVTYGSLIAQFEMKVRSVDAWLGRLRSSLPRARGPGQSR